MMTTTKITLNLILLCTAVVLTKAANFEKCDDLMSDLPIELVALTLPQSGLVTGTEPNKVGVSISSSIEITDTLRLRWKVYHKKEVSVFGLAKLNFKLDLTPCIPGVFGTCDMLVCDVLTKHVSETCPLPAGDYEWTDAPIIFNSPLIVFGDYVARAEVYDSESNEIVGCADKIKPTFVP